MNARQKAKKYKRELDRLCSIPIRPVVARENKDVHRFVAKRYFEYSPLYTLPPEHFIHDMLLKDIINNERFKEAVTFTTEPNIHADGINYIATIDIIY